MVYVSWDSAFDAVLADGSKAVCVRGQCIDAVLARVDSMVALVEGLDFSPLERANAGRWASVRAQFNSTNEEVKIATRDLINTCFRCSSPHK